MILENTINKASQLLKSHNVQSHYLDAQILLSEIMGVKREYLITNNRINISSKIIEKYNSVIKRRIKKEPIAYIIKKKEFWSMDFIVDYNTLIPRPETELLVHALVEIFKKKKINILDIGTGTGCILLSILSELKHSKGTGIDPSSKAIKVAKKNFSKFDLIDRTKLLVIDLDKFNNNDQFNLIVSNPPYIPSKEIKTLSEEITNYEPITALNGGIDGLDLIKKIIYKSTNILKRNGTLAIEIGQNQYKEVSNILRSNNFRLIKKVFDCNDNVRCIISTKI